MRIFSDDLDFVFYVKEVHTIDDVSELQKHAQHATDILKLEGSDGTQRIFKNKQEMIKYAEAL